MTEAPGRSAAGESPEPAASEILAMTPALQSLIERARIGDASVLPELRTQLKDHPEIWASAGNIAAHAREAWLNQLCGKDFAVAESLRLKLASMRRELAGESPPPLVRLLAEQVVTCHLQVCHADLITARTQQVPLRQADFLLKRQVECQRRFLRAVAALVTAQKLLPGGSVGSDPHEIERPASDGLGAGPDPTTATIPFPQPQGPVANAGTHTQAPKVPNSPKECES